MEKISGTEAGGSSLPSAFRLLLSAFCVLPSAFCLLLSAYCLLLFAGACTPGPKYAKPSAPTAPAYKELAPSGTGPESEWKASQPQDQEMRGKWWEIFNDPQLNSLEDRVDVSNQNLKIAEAQFRQARDQIRIDRSRLYPRSAPVLPPPRASFPGTHPTPAPSMAKRREISYCRSIFPMR